MEFLNHKQLLKKTAAQLILLTAVPFYLLILYALYGKLSQICALCTVSPAVPLLATAGLGVLLAVFFVWILIKPAIKMLRRSQRALRHGE